LSRVHDQARDRFLATLEIARRELTVLRYSQSKLFSQPIDARWASRLGQDMDAAETLEAFVSRFWRLQDTTGSHPAPSWAMDFD
jgi:hypothetical protein